MKPARVYRCLGSFGAPVSFSSDALGIAWELMGNNIFLRAQTTTACKAKQWKQYIGAKIGRNAAYVARYPTMNTKYGMCRVTY